MGEAQTDLREGHGWGAEVEGAHVSIKKKPLDETPPGLDHSREDAADTLGWPALLSWIYQLSTAYDSAGIAWGQWGTWGRDSTWQMQRSAPWSEMLSTWLEERNVRPSFLPGLGDNVWLWFILLVVFPW